MNTKKLIVILVLASSQSLFAQQDELFKIIDDSKDYYKQKKYREAAASLQEGINRINDVIGEQVLNGLPKEIAGLTFDKQNDQITSLGTLMGAGMTTQRIYMNEKGESTTIQITPNDPQVESLVTFISNPEEYGTQTDAGKVVKINDDLKAILKFAADEQNNFAYCQMPFYTAKIVFEGSGFKKEEDFVKFIQLIDYETLGKAMGYKK